MKFPAALALNVLCIAVGLFAYDHLRAPPESDGAPLAGYGVAAPTAQPTGSVSLLGAVEKTEMRALQARYDALTLRTDLLEQRLSDWAQAALDRQPRAPLGGLRQADVDEKTGPFDEGTLITLRAYNAEIRRRSQQERRVVAMKKHLKSLGVTLTAENQDVVNEAMAFEKRAGELMQSLDYPNGSEGMASRRQAFKNLREQFAEAVRKALPPEEAESLLESRLGRTGGYFADRGDK